MSKSPEQPTCRPPENRRAHRRFPVNNAVRVECRTDPFGLSPDICLSALNISEGGLGLILGRRLREGQSVWAQIRVEGRRESLRRQATVVWALPLDGGRCLTGLRFDSPLSTGVVHRLASWVR
jgi:hypothetical protein